MRDEISAEADEPVSCVSCLSVLATIDEKIRLACSCLVLALLLDRLSEEDANGLSRQSRASSANRGRGKQKEGRTPRSALPPIPDADAVCKS